MPIEIPRPLFGKLLTEGISSVARHKRVNMEIVEGDLAYEISQQEGRRKPLTFFTVQRWMRGYPPEAHRMPIVVRFCVRNGRISKDLAEGLLKQADCDHLLPMVDELYGSRRESASQKIYTNIPRKNPGFRGRENETAELLKRLMPENRAAVIVVYGLGGIGKTTLVTEVGHLCLSAEGSGFTNPYEAVVFTSARDRKLTLVDVYDEIGRVLENPTILHKPAEEKAPLVRDLLRKFQALLVLDNFETVDDPLLTRFALEEVPQPSKVVIATRDYHPLLWPGTWPIHLEGLVEVEALQLVREWANEHNLQTIEIASDADLESLIRATEGIPYALLAALGLIANQKQPLNTVLQDLWEGRGEIFDYIFRRGWGLLEKTERCILMAMPFFAGLASRKAIGATAGVGGYELSKGLGRLTELSLVTPLENVSFRSSMNVEDVSWNEPYYGIHPLTRVFAINRQDETPDFETEARERWMQWYVSFLNEHAVEDWPNFAILDGEFENILTVITQALSKHHPDASLLVKSFWYYLYIRGHWRLCENITREALTQVTNPARPFLRLWLASHLGWILNEKGEHEESLGWLHQIEQEILAMNKPTLLEETDVLNYLGQVYLWKGDTERAIAYETQFLELATKIDDAHSILTARYYLALASIISEQYGTAAESFQELVEMAKIIRWERARGYCAYRLGTTLIYLNDLDTATQWINHASELADYWHEPLLQAHVLFGRAQIQRSQKAPHKARALAQDAFDLYEQLEAHREMKLVEAFLTGLD